MSIFFDETRRLFTLKTARTSYQLRVDESGFVHHLHYGQPVGDVDLSYIEAWEDHGFSGNPHDRADGRTFSLDTLCQEYTASGVGDYRVCALQVRQADGSRAAELRYAGHAIEKGKYEIPGLPSAHEEGEEAETLILRLCDQATGLEVALYYGVFADRDVITRSARITNRGTAAVSLERAGSMGLDLPFGQWDLIQFHGRHCAERQPERAPVRCAVQTVRSTRGASSHHHNPFVILCDPRANEDWGACYGAMLVYSGSFFADVERDQMGVTRLVMGIGDENFDWQLEAGETFCTPEVLLAFSADGLTGLSHLYHDFIRTNICRGPHRFARRPILVNNWEATYFQFNEEKLLSIAREAASLGIELFVLDDGWFGKRDSDLSGLGDWYVNRDKLHGGLTSLIDGVHKLGMHFGIWVEPEMISEDSDLYRAHPDWALTIPGRAPALSRSQLVLDMSREDVRAYLAERLRDLLGSHEIDYVKWDMNRNITDAYSHALPAERQGEVMHRYILGVYALLEQLHQEFPQVLLEGCAGGGGRFDAGMLCYAPQIWCSDNTDALARLDIQYGTSFGYPVSAMGAHVSASPNHQTGRSSPLHTRGVVAMSGTFGYELDLTELTEDEKVEIRAQIARFDSLYDLIQNGRYYRLSDAMTDAYFTAWEFAARDGSEALLNVVVRRTVGNPTPIHVWLKGLQPDAVYTLQGTDLRATGAALMAAGYTLPTQTGDMPAVQLRFVRVGDAK